MIVERRKDNLTATHVRDALRMQRELGFEPAFALLRAKGLCAEKAVAALVGYIDRRQERDTSIEGQESDRPDNLASKSY